MTRDRLSILLNTFQSNWEGSCFSKWNSAFFISRLAITFRQLLNSMLLLCFKAVLLKKWLYQYTNLHRLQGSLPGAPLRIRTRNQLSGFESLLKALLPNWKHLLFFFNREGIIPYDILGTKFNSLDILGLIREISIFISDASFSNKL